MSTSTAPPRSAAAPSADSALLNVRAVAALLDCSPRHVYRLADAGKLPMPVRVGALVRWRRGDIQSWIDAGCRSIKR
jgi:excisionase family DNA binding protein